MTNRGKNTARLEKKQQRLDAGLISEHFPEISDIVVQMTYCQKGMNPIHVFRTVNFQPDSHAYFNMACLDKDCVDGGFDLNHVLTMMIRGRRVSGEGKIECNGNSPSSDHSSIDYKITIRYNNAVQ
jgi:hypothetical protein